MSTVSKSHQIDEAAQRLFRGCLPESWVIKKQEPDYHIDYLVEIVNEEELTGVEFYVQLKGSRKFSKKKKHVSLQMKAKHLKYYRNKSHRPVFIIVADLQHKQCYWLFIQEYIERYIADLNETTAIKKSINIPISNELSQSQIDVFKQVVVDSGKYMRELWPSSINAAVDLKLNTMKKLDPRLNIDISMGNGVTNYSMAPKPGVEFEADFNLSFPENELEKLKEIIDYGGFKKLSVNKLKIDGSELLSDLFNSDKGSNIAVEFGKSVDKAIESEIEFLIGNDKRTLSGVCGVMHHGEKGSKFTGELKNSPFSLQMLCTRKNDNGLTVQFTCGFNQNKWADRNVLSLPFYEKLYNFYKDIDGDIQFSLALLSEGNTLFRGSSDAILKFDDIRGEVEYLTLIKKIRNIASKYSIDLILPSVDKFSDEDWENIEFLSSGSLGSGYSKSAEGITADLSLRPEKELLDMLKGNFSTLPEIDLSLVRNVRLFGCQVTVIRTTMKLNGFSAVNNEEFLEELEASNDRSGSLKLIGLEGSKIEYIFDEIDERN